MFQIRKLAMVASGLTMCFAATPGAAAIVVATYSGTLRGTDDLGIFGAAGRDLRGAAFTATFLVDDTAGYYFQQSSQYVAYGGGTYYNGSFGGRNLPSPMTATLKIGDITYGFAPSLTQEYSLARIENYYYGEDGLSHEIRGPSNSSGYIENAIYARVTSTNNQFVNSTDLNNPVDRSVLAGDSSYGYASIGAYGSTRDVFDLFITRVTVTVQPSAAAVPEPVTWALMIAGFALVGSAIRRRHSTGVHA